MTELVQRKTGPNNNIISFHDPAFQQGNIPVDNENFNEANDRIYDIKQLKVLYIKIINQGANGLFYTIRSDKMKKGEILECKDDPDMSIVKQDGKVSLVKKCYVKQPFVK